METIYLDLFFLVFSLTFYIFILHYVHKSADKDYERKLMEAREFGFEHSKLRKEAVNYRPRK